MECSAGAAVQWHVLFTIHMVRARALGSGLSSCLYIAAAKALQVIIIITITVVQVVKPFREKKDARSCHKRVAYILYNGRFYHILEMKPPCGG